MPLKDTLSCISKYGFRSVELWADTVHFDPRAQISRKDIAAWLHEYRLHVHSAHAPFRNFANPPKNSDEFLKYRMGLWKETIDDCNELEIPILVMHALNRIEYPYTMEDAGIIKDTLAELCEYADQRGVAIALENIPDASDPKHNDISCTLKNQKALFEIEKLNFCLDIGHVPLSKANVFEEIDAAGERLISFHVHNNDGLSDAHNLPDDGIADWPKIYQYVREKGYQGEFVLEIDGRQDPEAQIKKIAALFNDN
ncbi:MAG: sugar phosphate isomerase/epimerase family protein [Bacillota bacterium]|nr:sugar phosphate isomerase/epimerase family protein [Bacillota bacterium]